MSEQPEIGPTDMQNGQGLEHRLSALERWRDAVDDERLKIAAELGEIKGLMRGVGDKMTTITVQLEGIQEKLEERPSRAEFTDRMDSIRAKATKGVKISELEVTGPGNMRFKLLGVSGVTIVLVFLLIVVIFALWFLRK